MARRLVLISEQQRKEISVFLEMAPRATLFSLIFSVISIAFFRYPFPLIAIASFLIGAGAAGLLFFSWRHYNWWWSWAIWAVPLALVGGLFAAHVVLPLVRVGTLSPLGVLFGVFGAGGLGLFAPLYLLRHRIPVWYGM